MNFILSVMLWMFPLIFELTNERFKVVFNPGAVYACTVYEQQGGKEPYAPRHCWWLDPTLVGYEDDWEYIERYDTDWLVYAEVGYPDSDGVTVYHETNKLKVHR